MQRKILKTIKKQYFMIKKAYIYNWKNVRKNLNWEKTQHLTEDVSESQYKTMHTIWSLEIHHALP